MRPIQLLLLILCLSSSCFATAKFEVFQSDGLSEVLELEYSEDEFGKWRRTVEICIDPAGSFTSHFCLLDDQLSSQSRLLIFISESSQKQVPDPSMSITELLAHLQKESQSVDCEYNMKVLSQSENDTTIVYEKRNLNEEDKRHGDFVMSRYIKRDQGFSKIEYAENTRQSQYSIEMIHRVLAKAKFVPKSISFFDIDISSGKEKNLIGSYYNFHNDRFLTLEFGDNKKWTHPPSMSKWNYSSVSYFPEDQMSMEIPLNIISISTQIIEEPESFSIGDVIDGFTSSYSQFAEENGLSLSIRLIEAQKNECLGSVCIYDEKKQIECLSAVFRGIVDKELLHQIEIVDNDPATNFSQLPYQIELARAAKIKTQADFGKELTQMEEARNSGKGNPVL